MKVLVYPHDLGMGGSQTNAIELAAAVRDLGHECVVYGQRGVLSGRIAELGLEFVESPRPSHRPTPSIVRSLRDTVRGRGIDVVHGYEWPPGLESVLAVSGIAAARAVCTVMSMAVAPFLPNTVPLIVGTRQIAAHERARGRTAVEVLEPPVDLEHNQRPAPEELAAFRAQWGVGDLPLLVSVSRLASELKAEGLLTAIRVAGDLAGETPIQFLVVGDGPARPEIAAAADAVNRRTGTNTVVMTGELLDPRPAYAVADVTLGMGGSALRSLAFGTPLIVQGEKGFFQTLTPDSADTFRWQGWYGVGERTADGRARLAAELAPLMRDVALRNGLGAFSGELVQEFSLVTAARRQLNIYDELVSGDRSVGRISQWFDGAAAATRFSRYFAAQKLAPIIKTHSRDDFNAQPVAATAVPIKPASESGDGAVLYVAGVAWDSVPGTDRRLALALSRLRPVIWADPPRSLMQIRRLGERVPRVSSVAQNLTRLSIDVLPGSSRPGLRALANRRLARHVLSYLHDHDIRPAATIVSTPEPMLRELATVPGRHIYFATDDFVAAAALWKRDPHYLNRSRERNLATADIVLAVTRELADELRRGPEPAVWFPNGTDLERFRTVEAVSPAPGIKITSPIAGVVGQFNERTDLSLLFAVQQAGISLLLVGPCHYKGEQADRFTRLTELANVQWLGKVSPDELPAVYKALTVGLTPYAESVFNRRSFPLKTLEYLAAGLPVVSTDATGAIDSPFVQRVRTAGDFVRAARAFISDPPLADEVRRSVVGYGWSDRAVELMALLERGSKFD